MLIYLLLLFLILFGLFFINNKKIKNCYFLLLFVFLISISAFRSYEIGNDTVQYVNFFKNISFKNFDKYLNVKYFEIGYMYLNYFIKFFSDNYIIFLVITSLIIYLGIFKLIFDNSKNKLFSLLLFVLLLYFFESMSAIRQYLAISIILISFGFVKERKFLFYLLSVLFATLFHKSAIICLVFYFLYKREINDKLKIILFILTTFLTLFGNGVVVYLLKKLSFYSSYLDRLGVVHLASVVGMIISFCVFLFVYFINDRGKRNSFYVNISFITFLLSILGMKFSIIGRMALYFEIFSIISIPNSIEMIKDKKTKVSIIFYVILFCFLYFIVIMYFKPDWYDVVPYNTSILLQFYYF